jgi:hypothetical protein
MTEFGRQGYEKDIFHAKCMKRFNFLIVGHEKIVVDFPFVKVHPSLIRESKYGG